MKTSAVGIALIKSYEKLRLHAYCDGCGKTVCRYADGPKVWTIGWGSTDAPEARPGGVITEARADILFARNLATAEGIVQRKITLRLAQREFDALVSFAFNTGTTGTTLTRKLNAGDRLGAWNEFSKWVYQGKKKLRGLQRRRQEEGDLFLPRIERGGVSA